MEAFMKKIKEIFESTPDSNLKFEGDIKNLDYYNLFCKAATKEQMFRIKGNNVCAFNYQFEELDAVLIVFSIPINTPEETGAKNVAERVMEVIENLERSFITLDYANSEEVKEDKFIYITIVKKLGER